MACAFFRIHMNSLATSGRRGKAGTFAAALMLALWLGTFLLAAAPPLHRLLHKDAEDAGHHCVVTLVQQHLLLASPAPVIAPSVPTESGEEVRCAEFQSVPACDYRLSPSRAPPLAFPSAVIAG